MGSFVPLARLQTFSDKAAESQQGPADIVQEPGTNAVKTLTDEPEGLGRAQRRHKEVMVHSRGPGSFHVIK